MLYYLWYMMGYEDEDEVTASDKVLKSRDMVHKQIRHIDKFKLKPVDKEIPVDMSASCYLEPAIPVGRIYTKPPNSWSKVVRKRKINRFTVLEDDQ